MTFADLAAFFDPTLQLPIRGKTYVIQPPAYKVGLRLEAMAALTQGRATAEDRALLRLDDNAQRDLFRDALGSDVLDEMDADGLTWPLIRAAGLTAYVWITQDKCKGTEYAALQWLRADRSKAGEASGEAEAPSTGADKAAPTTPSTSGAAATGTKRRAHGTTTTSPAGSSPDKAAPAGPTSSPAGRTSSATSPTSA